MEFFYVSLLCLFVFPLSLLLILLFYKNKSPLSGPPLPPGKIGWPIFGESLEFLFTGLKGHPEKFINDRIAKYSSNVFRTHLLGEHVAILSGASGNKLLFSNENKLVQVWWPNSLKKLFPSAQQESSSIAEEGTKLRNMLANFLKPKVLQRYVGVMDDMTPRHFASCWENHDQVFAYQLVKDYTFSLSMRLLANIEDPNIVAKFAKPFDDLAPGMISIPIQLPGTPFNRGIKASNFIRKELMEIVKQRKIDLGEGKLTSSPTQDLLSYMLLTCDEDGKFMEESDIVDKILGLLVGGHDTLSSTCTSIVKYLAELPHIYQGVYQEQMEIAKSKSAGELLNWEDIKKMKYSWNVACEVLRLAPPVKGAFREVLSDFIFNGFSIPKGWKIHWSTYSTHKSPEFFAEPEKFDPSRFEGSGPAPYTYIPFGGGPRMCPGIAYARLEILIFMHHLVNRFKLEKIIPDEKIIAQTILIPANGLPVRLYPHDI